MSSNLFAWLSSRAVWQQEAALRICEIGALTAEDIDELQTYIESHNSLADPPDWEPRRIALADVEKDGAESPVTVLASLGPVEHVDRLAPGQKPLHFAVKGVTLVYGANGSGKSGYCRIAKRLCRSLHSPPSRATSTAGLRCCPPKSKSGFE